MNSYNRYRGRRRPRRNSLMLRRLIFLAAAVAILVGLIVLVVRLASGKKTPDPAAPSIQPIATEAPVAEPSAEPAATEPMTAVETAAAAADSDRTEPGNGDIAAFAAGATVSPLGDSTHTADAPAAGTGRSLHVRIVGDIMFHKEQLQAARQSDGSYDFELQFRFIKSSLAAHIAARSIGISFSPS